METFHILEKDDKLREAALGILGECRVGEPVAVKSEKSTDGLHVWLKDGKASILYERPAEFFRGIGYLKQWLLEGRTYMERKEKPLFGHLTYMVDCSRNAVCKPEYIKLLIRQLAQMGYDRLMLYTEDTYEVDGYSFFGYFRGRYSKEELREIDDYACTYGIELVPCIQTLAHLNGIFHWRQFDAVKDTGDILCCGLEETYELIEAMVRTFAGTCRSRVINIGMDEAEMIGRGSFISRFGYQERFDIMERHLKRVVEICGKYGYTCMMWSDMFFKMLTGDKYYDKNLEITDEIRKRIPEGLELVYWDYYARDAEKYDDMMVKHKQLAEHVGFAGGAWKWSGFSPLLNHSMAASRLALENCRKHGIQNVIVTGWGDNGGEASQSVVLPVLSLYAEFDYAQNMEDDWIEKRLFACTGADYGDFLKLDCLNLTPDNPVPGRVSVGPAKYLLYQDVLLGIYDRHVDAQRYPKHYARCRKVLEEIAEKGGAYQYLFETLASLAAVLELKCDLGIRMKAAYDRKDREALGWIERQCKTLEKLLEEFHGKVKKQWLAENKVFGLEVLDIRLGGLKERIRAAAERIRDYLDGKCDKIEELEEERLLLDDRENPGHDTLPLGDNDWKKIVTACVL